MEQPISLYLDLEPGTKADFEVVARAMLAFSAAVSELSYVVDPGVEVRLKFGSGTEGSLSLNSIIKVARSAARPSRTKLLAIAAVVIIWFTNDIRTYGVGKVLDWLIKSDDASGLTPDEIDEIGREINRVLDGRVAEERIRDVFIELERDEAIRGVGATTDPGMQPLSLIPRADFAEHTESVTVTEETDQTRTRVAPMSVVLISPVLLTNQRRWRFSSSEGEFGASIKDEAFLRDVLSGRLELPMVAGIEMTVILETKEHYVDGVWTVKERNILRVSVVRPSPTQSIMNFVASPSPDEGNDQ